MLHVVDKAEAQRSEWIGLLARAPRDLLEAWAARAKLPAFSWLRRPEYGLAMVRARAGGSGEKFNLGEMTITRCALRLEGGASGVAYVQGRDSRKAELAALADALLQTKATAARARADLLEPIRAHLAARAAAMQRKAQATRVEFFTLAREAGE
jgi:alpha-D-ribose 1-methylphosphonate 5-triphosphate synthase subunit PhnG